MESLPDVDGLGERTLRLIQSAVVNVKQAEIVVGPGQVGLVVKNAADLLGQLFLNLQGLLVGGGGWCGLAGAAINIAELEVASGQIALITRRVLVLVGQLLLDRQCLAA